MSAKSLTRFSWLWTAAVACWLSLLGGCTPPSADDLGQFAADLLLSVAAALLL